MRNPPTDPLLAFQYYIDSSALDGATVDINLGDIWDDYTGAGVSVGIYDQAIEETHPDLDGNYNPSLEPDEDLDTAPHEREAHGTPVAGIIAAERNGEGTVGIAYDATITGLRLFNEYSWLGEYTLVRQMHLLDRFDVTNHSWGYTPEFVLKPGDTGAPGDEFRAAVDHAAANGRHGLGTIIVTGAGNDRYDASSPDMQPLGSLRQSIVVGAVDYQGFVTQYSEEGATVFVVAPSSHNIGPNEDVTTTDLLGEAGYGPDGYTMGFGGTSAAAPMVAAVAALMLEANPDLGWRDVQDILALTARHTGNPMGPPPGGPRRAPWIENHGDGPNNAGFHFSRDYGFGLIDAHAAVRLAETWTGQNTSADEISQRVAVVSPPANIRDAGAGGLVYTFDMAAGIDVEHIALDIIVSTVKPSGIVIELTSPSGTVEQIFAGYGYQNTRLGHWIFGGNAFRGEESGGVWTVRILNGGYDSSSTAQDLALTLYGAPESADDVHVFTDEYGTLALSASDVLTDLSGTDRLNGAALTQAARIDLNPGAVSTIAGRALTLAPGTFIETAIAGDGADVVIANANGNTLNGMRGNDTLFGGTGADTLYGGAGNDTLAGRAGANLLAGGIGDDTYVAGLADTIVETAGQGTDTIVSAVSFSLATLPNIENLRLTASGGATGTGNAARNAITGDSGNDTLSGSDGDDRLSGLGGNDLLDGGAGIDTANYAGTTTGIFVNLLRLQDNATGASIGADRLTGVENVTGGSGDDRLHGDANANLLDGGAGADFLAGGAGDDIYIVDTAADLIAETLNAGTDLVRSAVTFTLRDTHLENLTLTGAAAIDAIGNAFANILTGNDSANLIEGKGGADSLLGAKGNDTLDGGTGDDTLHGGAGADLFRFAAASGTDRLNGFQRAEDRFALNGNLFVSFTESAGSTRLHHAQGDIIVTGLTGLALADWNALVVDYAGL